MKVGDIVYTVNTNSTNLDHQPDSVEMWQGQVIDAKDEWESYKGKIFFQYKKRLYTVSKNKGYDDGERGVRFQIPFSGRSVTTDINEAKREMFVQIFNKREWLK